MSYYQWQHITHRPRSSLVMLWVLQHCMSWYLVFTWLDHLKSMSGNSNLERRSQHLLTNKLWRRTETTPRSRWGCSHMAVINSDYSTREMRWCELIQTSDTEESWPVKAEAQNTGDVVTMTLCCNYCVVEIQIYCTVACSAVLPYLRP